MSEWRETEFGELIDVINGFAFKSTNFLENKIDDSLPVIKIKNVANGNVHLNSVQYHSFSENLSKYLVKRGDVLIALTGNHPQAETQVVGLTSRYKLDCAALINQRVAKIVSKNEEILCTDYVYYFLRDINTHLYLASQSSGSANQANISKSDITNIPFSLPPENEQKAIAAVLSSLDDKIDLLHRQNKTLEAMAETLFRQWFIEEAQADWEDGVLGDVLQLFYGKALKDEIRTGSGFPVVGSSGIVGYHAEYLVNGPGIVIGRKGTLGKVNYLFQNFYPIDTTYYIQSKISSNGLFYEYFLLKTLNFENSDSAVPGLNRDIALSEEIKLVPLEKINAFNECCRALFRKLEKNITQIRTLEKLRDTLLPKLMSGEVRVAV